DDGSRSTSRRRSHPEWNPRCAHLRFAGRATPHRARAAAGGGGARDGAPRLRSSALARRRPLRAGSASATRSRGTRDREGSDPDHLDNGRRASGSAGPAARGVAGGDSRGMIHRVGDEVARELARFGVPAGLAPLVEAWPAAVGPEIARNAWPARISRDGTLHVHARSSAWAFGLGQLEGLEPVRLRPGMYIGSTGPRGLHQLFYEVVDNSVDEALAGRNDKVEVTLHPDNSVTVRDYGSGIPVDVMEDQGMSALTVVLT